MASLNELFILLSSSPLPPSSRSSSLYWPALAHLLFLPFLFPSFLIFRSSLQPLVVSISAGNQDQVATCSTFRPVLPSNFKVGILFFSFASLYFSYFVRWWYILSVIFSLVVCCFTYLPFLFTFNFSQDFSLTRDSKIPCRITGAWDSYSPRLFLHLFLRYLFFFQVFLYSYSFPLDPVSTFGFAGFGFFSLTSITRLVGRIAVSSCHDFIVFPIYRDRRGGGAGRAAAPPLFCAPAPTFCAKKIIEVKKKT